MEAIMEIKPWLTAIRRKDLSKPIKNLLDKNYLNSTDKILDYGCGHGKDVESLKQKNFNIKGFDKYIEPFNDSSVFEDKYDTVTCIYVLNVISTVEERIDVISKILDTLKSDGNAFIAVRSIKEFESMKKVDVCKYKDGIVTKRKTFQKYFSKDELLNFFNLYFPYIILEDITYSSETLFMKLSKKML